MNNSNKPEKNTLTSQRTVIKVLGVLVVLLFAAFLILPAVFKTGTVVTELPKYDEATGDYLEYSAIKNPDGTFAEVTENDDSLTVVSSGEISYNVNPFIYPEIKVENLKEVLVKNSTGEYALYLDEVAKEHLIRGNEMQMYNEQALSNLRFQARFMMASQRFPEIYDTEEKLAPFGLDAASNPASVTVTDVNGNSYTVYIGNSLVSGNGYYAKDSDPYVYILDSSVSVFFEDKNTYISPVLTLPLTQQQYQYADSFSIHKNGEPFLESSIVPEDKRQQTSDTDLHKITYPGKYPASFNNYYMALECFANLTGEKVVETNVYAGGEEYAKEVFEKYGLMTASNDVSVISGGNEYRFLTGDSFTDENGRKLYYAYSPTFDTVVTLPVENAPFIEHELLDFINSSFFQVNITNVAEVTVNIPGESYAFVIEGEGSGMTVTERNTGKSIDVPSFRQFYISLLTAKIEGYAGVEDVTGDKELTFRVKSIYGETTTYDFSLISTTRELLTLDGSSQFYTARSYVTKIIEKLKMLINGEIIAPEY